MLFEMLECGRDMIPHVGKNWREFTVFVSGKYILFSIPYNFKHVACQIDALADLLLPSRHEDIKKPSGTWKMMLNSRMFKTIFEYYY